MLAAQRKPIKKKVVKKEYVFTRTIKWGLMINKNMKSIINRFEIDEKWGYYLLRDTEGRRRVRCDTIEEAQNQAEFCI